MDLGLVYKLLVLLAVDVSADLENFRRNSNAITDFIENRLIVLFLKVKRFESLCSVFF